MGTSGLMSGEWKRSEWRDTQTPATERAGHSYGPPSRHRATPRLHKLRGALRRGILAVAKAALAARSAPQRAVRNEPTPATDKRPAARRVFGEKAVWLRPARECFRSCSVVAAHSASFVAPAGLFPENSAPRSFQTGSEPLVPSPKRASRRFAFVGAQRIIVNSPSAGKVLSLGNREYAGNQPQIVLLMQC